MDDGFAVGLGDGFAEGLGVGLLVGLGLGDGFAEGSGVGSAVGRVVGSAVQKVRTVSTAPVVVRMYPRLSTVKSWVKGSSLLSVPNEI